nr:uncharacterized protein LOC118063154 isoform X5 [Populus alba]
MQQQQQQKHHRHKGPPRQPLIELQPGQVAFRVVCHVSKIGGLISHSSSVISPIWLEAGCLVHCEEAVKGSEHRVIVVVGSASPEKKIAVGEGETVEVSGAQEAVVRVLERMWRVDGKKDGGEYEGYCGLLANTSQIGAVVGREGRNIKRMKRTSGAHIWILQAPLCALKEDQLIQITGSSTLAVKKAVIAVTSCLQDYPTCEKDEVGLGIGAVRRRRSGSSGDPNAEFSPHSCSLLPTYSENIATDGDNKKPNEQSQVQFRMICSHGAAGIIIGKGGSVVRALQNQTGASIIFAPPITNSDDRLVTVSALENLESSHSPAQKALLLVFARSIEHDIERARSLGLIEEITVTATLLLPSNKVSCLIGRGGRVDSEMIETTGADIQILQGDRIFDFASKNDAVVQITGEEKNVQNALFQVTCKLRENLLPTEMLNGLRTGSLYRRAGEITMLHQSAGESLDSNQETSFEKRLDQITGSSSVAIKKAVIDVTSCLQDCPPYEKDEVDLSLGAVRRRRSGSSGEPMCSLLPTYSENIATDGDNKKPNEQSQVQFRMICSHGAAGSIIGTGGSIVRALQNQTGASISFAPPITNSDDRLVTVSALENLESSHSPAQNALLLVFARSIEHDIERARSLGLIEEITVTATLMLPSNKVSCLIGRGGRVDSEMIETTGADIQILQGDRIFDFASKNDAVVQITGEEKNVQNALFQVTCKLRENLLPTEMLNGLRTGSPYRRAGEITMLHQSAGESLDSNQETSFAKRFDQVRDTPSSLLQLPQITGSSSVAIKKAVIDVTSCLQDCPPYEKDEVDLSLGAGRRRRSGSSGEPMCSLLPTYSENIATDGDNKKPNEQSQVQFRMICSHGAAGRIIGTGGSVVRALQNQTGASIIFAPPITNSDDRLVTVSALENLESSHSPAQNALLLVFARSIEHDIERARSLGLIEEITVTATLLLPPNKVSCLIGRGGRVDSEMIETTGADIQILQGDRIFDFASKNDAVMQITGEHKNVQNALFQVTCKLRDNLLPTKMLSGLRAGSPYRSAGESTMSHQSAGSVSRRMSRFQSGNRFGRKSGSST